MAPFTLLRHSVAPVDRVWQIVTDVARHGDWIPLTRMRADPGPMGLGWGFRGITGLGPVGLSDDMVVTEWAPPSGPGTIGTFRVVKVGWWLDGWAEASVEPDGSGGSILTWTEELGPRPALLGRAASPLTARVAPRLFGRVLDGMVARAEGRETTPGDGGGTRG
jgi:hypothetical protein